MRLGRIVGRVGHVYPIRRRVGHIYPLSRLGGVAVGRKGEAEAEVPAERE